MIAQYLNDSYQFCFEAKIVDLGSDDVGAYYVLDNTIFYPQGGGQPSDQGTLVRGSDKSKIVKVLSREDQILHYVENSPAPFRAGDSVTCLIDRDLRLDHAACHTSGHLLSDCAEFLEPGIRGVKGYHFLQGPYLEFSGERRNFLEPEAFLEALNDLMKEKISENLEIRQRVSPGDLPGRRLIRHVQIGSFPECPCGGTHLRRLSEIIEVRATKLKRAKDRFRVSYRFSRKNGSHPEG